MTDVTGSIGNNPVKLNNAATEATLRQLLQAVVAAGTKNTSALNALAQNSGLNANAIQQANQAVGQLQPQMNALGKASFMLGATFGQVENTLKTVWDSGEKLAAGTAQASGLFENLGKILPGPIGAVATGLGKLANFQEELLVQYQSLTKSGANFGGSLTDMRMAASQTYMTMQEFTQVITANSTTLAKMGGSVDQGARSFVTMSNSLLKSAEGTGLRALGYTTQEVNQGLLDYINLTGGRTRKELQNTEALTKGATEYLEQLDGLSKLTGESREALAAKMKEEAANQAWEGYLLTLDEEGRKKANAARLEAEARGGKGAAQALQAKLMGLPPMTEAAQKFVGTMQNGNQALDGLAAGVKDNTKSVEDVKRAGAGFSQGLARDGQNLKQVGSAMIMAGKDVELYGRALKAANDAQRNEIKSTEDQIEFERKIAEEAKKQKESEAEAAVKTKKALEEMGQKLLAAFLPVAKAGLAVVNAIGPWVPEITAAVAAVGVFKAAVTAKKLLGALQGGQGLPIPGGGPPAPGGPTPGGPGGRPGIGSRVVSGLKGGAAGLAGGFVLDAASNAAKEQGMEKTAAGLDIASDAASFAGTGAMIGSIVPGVGTVAGGLIGGVAGTGYGLYKNWRNLFGGKSNEAAGAGPAIDPSTLAGSPPMTAAGQQAALAGLPPTTTTGQPAALSGLDSGSNNQSVVDMIKELEQELAEMKESSGEGDDKEETLAVQDTPKLILARVESLSEQLQMLNKQAELMVAALKETAENTKRNVDATKELNGDLFS